MSEGLRDYNEIFATVDRKHKIYIKTGVAVPLNYDVPRSYALTQSPGISRSPSSLQVESNIWPELELQRAADRIVLARFGPPGLVVDERMNVLQWRGQTSPFLELTPGNVSWNLLRVLREGIAGETRTAVQRAIRENIPSTATAVLVDDEKGEQQIQIDVLPITSGASRARCFLVLFQHAHADGQRALPDPAALPQLTPDEKDRLVALLRQDLSSTRFHLQSLVEERDARNQELVSANEEIQSANEELQSTNEELETTKEELQSANEELQTVNEELQQRNNTLTQTGNDLTNLLNSVNIPLLMLTSEFNIRQFTPPMQKLLSVRAADIGRSINEIRLQLSIDDITPILRDVLETLGTREVEVQDREGRWHLLRVRPYRTADNKIEGLVVVLLDIDQLRSSQQHLVDAHHFAESVVECVPVPVVVLNNDLSIRMTNTAFRDLTQLSAKELERRSMPDLSQVLWDIENMRERLTALLANPKSNLEFEHESRSSKKMLLIKGQVLVTDGDQVLLLMMEDITIRREAERLINAQKAALESEVQMAARTLSRTKEELRSLTSHLFTVQEEEREHVARELHDDISQRLAYLQLQLTAFDMKGALPTNVAKISTALDVVQSLNEDIRQISHRLHPAILKDLGLPAALQALIEDFESREGMPATFFAENLPQHWSEAAATALYRITQEALRNVVKHAGKTHVKLFLEGVNDVLQLKVMDFGRGFDAQQKPTGQGLGLISMQERARIAGGTLSLESSRGRGTTVTIRLPLE